MYDRQAQTAKALAKAIGARVVADGGVALRIRYVGSPESSQDYADAVLVSATSLTLSVNGSADTTVGSAGVLAFATYTTLGALVDAINLSANWEAEIVGGLRTDSTGSSVLLARSTSTFRPYLSLNLYWDSSAASKITYLLEPAEAFATEGQVKQHRVGIKRVQGLVNTSDSGTWDATVYEVAPDRASALKTVLDADTADNTALDTGAVDEPIHHADYGNSLLVVITDGSWSDTGAYLDVAGVRE